MSCYCRDQCEELRAVLTKRHQNDVCFERAEQLRMKHEAKQKSKQGYPSIVIEED